MGKVTSQLVPGGINPSCAIIVSLWVKNNKRGKEVTTSQPALWQLGDHGMTTSFPVSMLWSFPSSSAILLDTRVVASWWQCLPYRRVSLRKSRWPQCCWAFAALQRPGCIPSIWIRNVFFLGEFTVLTLGFVLWVLFSSL